MVDASVVVKWHVHGEKHTEQARLLLSHFAQGKVHLVAPDLIRYEVPSALTAATLGSNPRLTYTQGREAIEEFLSLDIEAVDCGGLVLASYALVHQLGCALYDTLYLALSQDYDIPLITADRRFYAKVCHLPNVLWIGNYS